jgi:hypothetical protein
VPPRVIGLAWHRDRFRSPAAAPVGESRGKLRRPTCRRARSGRGAARAPLEHGRGNAHLAVRVERVLDHPCDLPPAEPHAYRWWRSPPAPGWTRGVARDAGGASVSARGFLRLGALPQPPMMPRRRRWWTSVSRFRRPPVAEFPGAARVTHLMLMTRAVVTNRTSSTRRPRSPGGEALERGARPRAQNAQASHRRAPSTQLLVRRAAARAPCPGARAPRLRRGA